MSKTLTRIVSFLLVPCLIADPVIGSAFCPAPITQSTAISVAQPLFNDQALSPAARWTMALTAFTFTASKTIFANTRLPKSIHNITSTWHAVPISSLLILVSFGLLVKSFLWLASSDDLSSASRSRLNFGEAVLRNAIGQVVGSWMVLHIVDPPIWTPYTGFDLSNWPGLPISFFAYFITGFACHRIGDQLFGKWAGAEIEENGGLGRHTLGQRIAFLIGGPTFNLTLGLLSLVVLRFFLTPTSGFYTVYRIVNELATANLAIGIGALLPISWTAGGLLILRLSIQWLRQQFSEAPRQPLTKFARRTAAPPAETPGQANGSARPQRPHHNPEREFRGRPPSVWDPDHAIAFDLPEHHTRFAKGPRRKPQSNKSWTPAGPAAHPGSERSGRIDSEGSSITPISEEEGRRLLKEQLNSANPHEAGVYPDISFEAETDKRGSVSIYLVPVAGKQVRIAISTGLVRPGKVLIRRFIDPELGDYRITTQREVDGKLIQTESRIVPHPTYPGYSTFAHPRLGEEGLETLRQQLISANPHEAGVFPDLSFEAETNQNGSVSISLGPVAGKRV